MYTIDQLIQALNKFKELGIALSVEKNLNKLLERILIGAKDLSNADGGTIYTITDDKRLKFEIVKSDTLELNCGPKELNWRYNENTKASFSNIFKDIPLYFDGSPNKKLVVAYSVINDITVNINDVYNTEGFDFSGTKYFDSCTGYRTKSLLTIPLKNYEDKIIGVLQLLNAKDKETGDIVDFSLESQHIVETLASYAAVVMSKQQSIEDLKNMFESLINVLVDAIDAKSPYAGNHCRKVTKMAMMIASAVNETKKGPFASFAFTVDELYELYIASLLHDCGKIITPVHIEDKSHKLETIFDRINLIETRFEVIKRDLEIIFLKEKLQAMEHKVMDKINQYEEKYNQALNQLDKDKQEIISCNIGSECMSNEQISNIEKISKKYHWNFNNREMDFFSNDEIENLSIRKGTLTEAERKVIKDHVVMTIKMLKSIPYPDYLKNIPHIAGAHHERIDGNGYPNAISGDQMMLQAKILALADIFEALTAQDRPYKSAMSLSEALHILEDIKNKGGLDPDIYDVFMDKEIFLKYADKYLHYSSKK